MRIITIIFITLAILGLALSPSYAKKNKEQDLPPGLQKKVERGGELPPGWEKKLKAGEILDQEIYEKGIVVKPVDGDGVITIKIDDKIIRLIEATREIIDVLSE